jgi:hypothetical protein
MLIQSLCDERSCGAKDLSLEVDYPNKQVRQTPCLVMTPLPIFVQN